MELKRIKILPGAHTMQMPSLKERGRVWLMDVSSYFNDSDVVEKVVLKLETAQEVDDT